MQHDLNSNNKPTADSHYELTYPIFSEILLSTNDTIFDYLQNHMPLLSEQELTAWLSSHVLTLDGEIAQPDTLIGAGQRLSITLANHFEQKINLQWHTIWQNDEILAAYKPAPLAVSRTTRNLYDTLIGLIRRQTPFYSAQLLHRLDIETSGLILIAKNKQSDSKHKKNLKQLIEVKTYHAIVKGVPQWSEYTCETQLAERLDSAIRCKMFVVDPLLARELYKKPKDCKTHFRLLKTQGEYSLIECQLFTGRKHQIRAHLAHLNLPIVGDKIYSHNGDFFLKRLEQDTGLTDEDYQVLGSKNHLLKAVTLGLRLNPTSSLITLRCESFSDDLSSEIIK